MHAQQASDFKPWGTLTACTGVLASIWTGHMHVVSLHAGSSRVRMHSASSCAPSVQHATCEDQNMCVESNFAPNTYTHAHAHKLHAISSRSSNAHRLFFSCSRSAAVAVCKNRECISQYCIQHACTHTHTHTHTYMRVVYKHANEGELLKGAMKLGSDSLPVYIYTYIYIYIYIYIYTHIYVCIYKYVNSLPQNIYICVCVSAQTSLHLHMYVYVCMNM
jgi:hypothetical protein